MPLITLAASAAVQPSTFSGPHVLFTAGSVTGLLARTAGALLKVRSVDLGGFFAGALQRVRSRREQAAVSGAP